MSNFDPMQLRREAMRVIFNHLSAARAIAESLAAQPGITPTERNNWHLTRDNLDAEITAVLERIEIAVR